MIQEDGLHTYIGIIIILGNRWTHFAQFKLGPSLFFLMSFRDWDATGSPPTTTWTQTATTSPIPITRVSVPKHDDWEAEWKKLRAELLERLLSDNPEGIIKYHQERTSEYTNQVRVKLTLEYFPLVKDGKPRTL